MQTFLTLPAMQDLGRALAHFLWQGTLLAALYFLAARVTQSAKIRYAAGCAVMLAMPVAFLATILRIDRTPVPSSLIQASEIKSPDLHFQSDAEGAITAAPSPPRVSPLPSLSNTLPGYIASLWLAGVLALSVFTLTGWLRVQRLKRRDIISANPPWLDAMETLKRRLRISKPIHLCISAIAEVPTVVGWLRPCILLPVCALTGLDELQLRAILAHELAHIRRHDYVVNLLQNAIETLLFYHPAVWWVSRQVRQEREHCCDDLAVDACGDVMLYAAALTQLEELRGNHPEPALAATGGDLLARIRRLLGTNNAKGSGQILGSVAAAMTAALALVAWLAIGHAPAIHAQSPVPKAAEFEAASIKPSAPYGPQSHCGVYGGPGTDDPGMITWSCRLLRNLLMTAFDVPAIQIANLKSMSNTGYDIVAKLPPGTTKEQIPVMLRKFLEEQFHMTWHSEMRDSSVWLMTVAKSGSKLKLASATDSSLEDRTGGPPQLDGDFVIPPRGEGAKITGWYGATYLAVREITTAKLADLLTPEAMRPVIDKTGLTGTFDLKVAFMPVTDPDAVAPPPPPPPPGGGSDTPARVSEPPPSPGIFNALQHDLGLRLDPGKGPVKFIVIDHMDSVPVGN